jgi:hypothetical protein
VFELREVLICTSLTREEPTECGEWSIHATCRIDARPDLESYEISIIFRDFLSSLQELAQSTRAGVLHLGESESGDHAILSDDRHTVRDRPEGREVDVASQYIIDTSDKFKVQSSKFRIIGITFYFPLSTFHLYCESM